jgi:outer membrane cobalamin receptor
MRVSLAIALGLVSLLLFPVQARQQQSSAPSTTFSQTPPLTTTVTVNATLTTEEPGSVSVLNQEQIKEFPGIELDDRLRQEAGFSLFRRSSSIVANPTTQGVSLRGIGSSGASRTLVLWDGIPVNDPFGGWVYWDRIDPAFIERVEIDRGATTSVFGDRAMGGTIAIFSPPPQHEFLFGDFLAGNDGTEDVSAAYSNLWGPWGLTAHSRDFTTDGYYIAARYDRGTADRRANVQFATGDVNIDYLGLRDRLAIHFDLLAEGRDNGTRLTHNSTSLGTVGATYAHTWTNDEVSFTGYHTQEQYHSTYSSVSLNRDVETLTSRQRVPIQDTGGAAYWRHHGRRWNVIGGGDADDTHGISYDYSYSTHVLTPSGGTLVEHGLFAEGNFTIGSATFFAGIRHEFTGEHGETYVSPNAGAALGLRNWRLRASGYKSFRAPTLNELYRNFRVGNAETLANSDLKPEGLVGVEAGADWYRENTRISFTLFHNDLNDLIDNATLRTTRTLILRERENFPSALSRGIEAGVHQQWRHWSADAGYQYADARLATGQMIPEIPKHTGTAELTFAAKGTRVSGGLRAYSLVFDDDLNQFLLPGFATLGATAQQHLVRNLSAVAQVDNFLDRTYLVALTPNPNIGSPRLWRVGLRWAGAIK